MTIHFLFSIWEFLAFRRRFVGCGVHGFHGSRLPSQTINERHLDKPWHAALSRDGAVQDPKEVFEQGDQLVEILMSLGCKQGPALIDDKVTMLGEAFTHLLKVFEDGVETAELLLRQPLFANATSRSPTLSD